MIMQKGKEQVDLAAQTVKVPKIISKRGHEYILVEQCNDDLWLYKDLMYGYKCAFTSFELGLRKN